MRKIYNKLGEKNANVNRNIFLKSKRNLIFCKIDFELHDLKQYISKCIFLDISII